MKRKNRINNFKNFIKAHKIIVALLTVGVGIILLWKLISNSISDHDEIEVDLNTFIYLLETREIESFTISQSTSRPLVEVEATWASDRENSEEDTINFYIHTSHVELISELAIRNEISVTIIDNVTTSFLWGLVGYSPIIFFIFFIYLISKKSNIFDVKKKKNVHSEVNFEDVAGHEEEKRELSEVVDILKNQKKYAKVGARVPKGILLVGPPGTGKTLLAKAMAGEADVSFFASAGSEFNGMLVGLGAKKIKDLFKDAKKQAPCILFIDEIDTLGRNRSDTDDNSEQTLNQLLTEMDGFESGSGIIVVGATNLPEVLDPALLRPGRFDRQVKIGLPDVEERTKILELHAKNKKLATDVNLRNIAGRTPGFSGADLENLMNESIILATRDDRTEISISDIDEAADRVLMGSAKKSKVLTEKERQIIAYHEAGHVVAGLKLDSANIVHKVTIVARGDAGGYAVMIPEEEMRLNTKSELLDQITGLLAGRVAEEIQFGSYTSGAQNDFRKAVTIARAMVVEYGMNGLELVQPELRSVNQEISADLVRNIDKMINDIISDCYQICQNLLLNNRQLLTSIAEHLLKAETLTKEQIDEIYSLESV